MSVREQTSLGTRVDRIIATYAGPPRWRRAQKQESRLVYALLLVFWMHVHLIDGTYELFRHFHALPRARDEGSCEVAAVRGVLGSILGMIKSGATHVGVATDHVIESFRNGLRPGYKTGDGIEPELLSQFGLLEETLRAAGILVWPMIEFEADDALASAAAKAEADFHVEQVIICSPDKDLAQCVRGKRVVQLDRRQKLVRDEAGVLAKFGVGPQSIPDYLALVGDAADGYPGLPGWGAKSTAAVLSRYGHIEQIPNNAGEWHVQVAAPAQLAETLKANYEAALLFRDLATLRTHVPVFESIDELRWHGPTPAFDEIGKRLDDALIQETAKHRSGRTAKRESAQTPAAE